jgi:hypothetical protein
MERKIKSVITCFFVINPLFNFDKNTKDENR